MAKEAKLGFPMQKSPLRDFYGAEFPITVTVENCTYCPMLAFSTHVPAHSKSAEITVNDIDQLERFVTDIKHLSQMHKWQDAVILTMVEPETPTVVDPTAVTETKPVTPPKAGAKP
jgi:hypothetical protein